MDDASIASDAREEGLFLTAVATQRETHRAAADPHKKKLILVLACSGMPPAQYEERISGPMRPGVYLYKWLLRGAGLAVGMPDTLLVEKNIVRLIYNDAHTGQIIKAKPLGDSKKSKRKFIREVLGRFLDPPADPYGQGQGQGQGKRAQGTLAHQVVAVVKKPYWRSGAGSETEVHSESHN
jgi:hypothetical protein